MRIATYNIHRAIGRDGREDHGRIAGVLGEISADIVALQEVGFRAGEAGNFLHRLADRAKAEVIEGVTLQDERGHYGNALLSRLPAGRIRLVRALPWLPIPAGPRAVSRSLGPFAAPNWGAGRGQPVEARPGQAKHWGAGGRPLQRPLAAAPR